jgi:two-component system phosphate regulon response regulator PhoB
MSTSQPAAIVVDDEPHIRHMLEFKLTENGYVVHTASNGETGYQLACEHAPDIILVDLQMPVCDGLTMGQRLARNPDTADIPIIMLTARGHRVPAEELARTNIRMVMAKPFSPRELLGKANGILGIDPGQPDRGTEAAAA